MLVLVILAAIWAAVLVPPYLQNRRETRPGDSIASFRSQLSVLALVVATFGAALWSWAVWGEGRRKWVITIILWLAVAMGISVQLRLREVATDWPQLQREIEAQAARALNAELDRRVTHGERAVAALARELQADPPPDSARLFGRMELIRRSEELSALAIFDQRGEPIAWAGEHRGQIPVAVRRGTSPYVFFEGPLFSHLYFVLPLPEGANAVAAVLLESGLQTGGAEVPFATHFEQEHGLLPVFTYPQRAVCPSIWDRAVLSACFSELSQASWWARVLDRGRWEVGGLLLLAMGLLSIRWYRRRMPYPGLPVGLSTAGLLVMPLGSMLGSETLFSPSQFVLPRLPYDVSLGMLLLLLVSLSIWLLTRTGGSIAWRWRGKWPALALIAAVLIPMMLELLRVSTGAILVSNPAGGFGLQLAGVLLLAIPLFLLLVRVRRAPAARLGPRILFAVGIGISAVLAVIVAVQSGPVAPTLLWSVLWGAAFVPFARAIPQLPVRYRPLNAWLAAGILASTCVLPTVWGWHIEAKLRSAEERELSRLGTEANPYLDFRLRVFAERARAFAAQGESGVNLLYHSWIESRLAEEGYEARLTVWRDDGPHDVEIVDYH